VTQPMVALESPSESESVSGMVALRATASDDVGVTLVEFVVNGTTIGLDSSAPYTITWDSSSMLGVQVLTAKAYDHGHNLGTSAEVQVSVLPWGATPTATLTPTRSLEVTPTATATPSATPDAILPATILMPLVLSGGG